MHTAPAASTLPAKVPSPGPFLQNSGKGSRTPAAGTFQDLYKNLAVDQDGDGQDQPVSASVPSKKKIAGDEPADAAAAVPAQLNSAVPANSILSLAASLLLAPQTAEGESQASSSEDADSPQNAPSVESSPTPLSGALLAGGAPEAAHELAQPPAAASIRLLSETSAADFNDDTAPSERDLARTHSDHLLQQSTLSADIPAALSLPVPVATHLGADPGGSDAPAQRAELETDQKQGILSGLTLAAISGPTQSVTVPVTTPSIASDDESRSRTSDANASAADGSSLPATPPERSLPLSADNLAFSMRLSKTPDTTPASLDAALPAQSATNAKTSMTAAQTLVDAAPAAAVQSTEPEQFAAPAQGSKTQGASQAFLNPPPARTLPDVAPQPHVQASTGSAARQQQDSAKSGSSQRDSADSSKEDAGARAQISNNQQESPSATPANPPSNTLRQAPASLTSWLNGTAQAEIRPMSNNVDQPTPLRLPLAASLQEIHILAAEGPKASGASEILLQVGEGPSTAAVRVVDRAGAVNVSVHAADQDLRTSLRGNLADLTAQLNTQGLKTDSVKTTPPQSTPDSRSDQGTHDQRSGGQQHSASQGDRQSQRDRRTTALWLDELQEQTSTAAANPGGSNS